MRNTKLKISLKFRENYENEVSQQPRQDWSEGGEAGQHSPGASSALTQILPYSASLYTFSILSFIILWVDVNFCPIRLIKQNFHHTHSY